MEPTMRGKIEKNLIYGMAQRYWMKENQGESYDIMAKKQISHVVELPTKRS